MKCLDDLVSKIQQHTAKANRRWLMNEQLFVHVTKTWSLGCVKPFLCDREVTVLRIVNTNHASVTQLILDQWSSLGE